MYHHVVQQLLMYIFDNNVDIDALRIAEDRLAKCLILRPNYHQAHYYMGRALLLQARNEPSGSSTFVSLVTRAKDSFFSACQALPNVRGISLKIILNVTSQHMHRIHLRLY